MLKIQMFCQIGSSTFVKTQKRILRIILVSLFTVIYLNTFGAEKYPTKPIRILVGFSAGGPVDNISRVISKRLSEVLGQPFIVENRSGASSMIAAQMVAGSQPDGYTLLMVASTHAINPAIYKNISFDTVNAFSAIGFVAENAFVLVTNSQMQINSVNELIKKAKSETIPLNYASAGVGGLPHLAGELFKNETHIDANHIPYKGAAPATMDLLANQVVFMFNNMQSSLPYIHDGRLKALGVTSAERLNILPNVPTFKELGFKKLEFTGWYGLLGPAGLPQSITNTLNDLLQSILRERNIADQIRLLGAEPRFGTPKDFQEQINSDINRWSDLIKQSNIKGL